MPWDTICTLPLPSELFAQVLHPSLPLLSVGLSSGHVYTYRLPSPSDADDDHESYSTPSAKKPHIAIDTSSSLSSQRRSSNASESGLGAITTLWSTHRHKGSCRALGLSHDGTTLSSGGTDGLVKIADYETGKVKQKLAVPKLRSSTNHGRSKSTVADTTDNAPTVLHPLDPQTLLLGTDAGKLHVFDLRSPDTQTRPSSTFSHHDAEHITSITPLVSGDTGTTTVPKTVVSTGGVHVAVTDLRKCRLVQKSAPQDEELTTSVFVSGLKAGGTSVGQKLVVGTASGVLSLWERGQWDDLDERIVVAHKEVSVESLTVVPDFATTTMRPAGANEKVVAVGLEDGTVRFVRLGPNKIVPEMDVKHDLVEGPVGLGFDIEGRMVTGGGMVVKVWTEARGLPGGMRETSGDAEEEDDESESEMDGTDEEEPEGRKRKRQGRKRGKNKHKNVGNGIKFSGLG